MMDVLKIVCGICWLQLLLYQLRRLQMNLTVADIHLCLPLEECVLNEYRLTLF